MVHHAAMIDTNPSRSETDADSKSNTEASIESALFRIRTESTSSFYYPNRSTKYNSIRFASQSFFGKLDLRSPICFSAPPPFLVENQVKNRSLATIARKVIYSVAFLVAWFIACQQLGIAQSPLQGSSSQLVSVEYDISDLSETPEKLVTILSNSTGGEYWSDNGGKGEIEEKRDAEKRMLIVRQTLPLQASVGGLLQSLRRFEKSKADVAKPVAYNGYWKDTPSSEKLRNQLDSRLDFECRNVPLNDAFKALSAKCDAEIILEVESLAKTKSSPKDPVTVNAKDKALADILTEMTRAKGLSWELLDDKLRVGVFAHERIYSTPAVYSIATRKGTNGFSKVMSEIMTTVTPSDWSSAGGLATIMPYGKDLLIISQNSAGHRAIKQFLEQPKK